MMVNSTVCQDIMKEFRLLLQKLRKMTVGNAEAEDLLSKLVFEFSPCCRLSEYINDYNKKEMEIKHYENQYLLSQPISPSPLRHSTSFIQSGLNLPKLQFEECSGIVSEPISPLKDEVKQSISSNMMVASKSYDSSNYIESEEKVKNLRRPSIFSVNSKPKPNFLRRLSVQLNKPDKKEMNIKKTETMNPPQRKNSIGNLMDNFGFKSIIDKSKLKGSSTLPIRSKKRDKESSLQLHNRTKSGDVSLFKGWPFSTSQNDLTDNNTESIVCRICDETVYKHDFEHHSEECAITQLHEMKFHEIHNEYGVILSELGEALNEKKLNQEGATIVKKFIKHIKILEKESNDLLGLCMENIIDEENWIKKKLKEIMYFSKDLNFVKNYAKQTLEVSNSLRSVVDNYLEKLRHLNKDSISIPSSPTSTTNYFSRGRSKEVSESRLRHMNKLYRSNSNTSSTSSEDSPMSQKLISLLSGMLKNSLRKNKSSPTSSKSSDSNNSSKRGKIPQINDFEIIKPISRGAFGKVYLSRKKATQDLFAIKVIRKDDMIRKNMIREVMTERKVMSLAQMPYVVNLFYAFHSKNYLYLVQEYLIGGDLSSLITGMGGLTIEMARFYTAETALALNYLHKNGVIHRDLKPDNILLNGDGHLKLTDFGLSRIVVKENERSQTVKTGVLGTPDYLAPELLLGIGHHTPVDWWALGVCLFEFLCAYPPFMDGSPEAIFKNILDHNIQWPEDGIEDPLAEDLIKGLLNSDPNSRLQGERIKEHPFFSGLDFDTIRESEAPFKPCPEDLLDTSYFDMRNERPDIQKLEDENGFDVDIMMESGEADRESKENKRHSQQKEEVQVKVIKPDKESGLFTPQPKHASLKKGRPRAISASYNQKNIEPDFDAFVYKNIPLLSEYNKDLSSSPSRNRVSLPAQAKSSSFT
ncbi:kinase-like protein [Neoconidiobolus thromboides FSU 785]|nr:kinase-like protein [Neoconidiobolus thromboides FSU 785]